MDALFKEEQVYETKELGTDRYSGKVGAFEGALYEADRVLPAAGRLHHVHARRGALLRRLPARDRARHRPLQCALGR